jgi:putative DNA primase/helicase
MTAETIARALDGLCSEPRWVAWRNEQRGDKTTKIPYAANGRHAKADDPSTWATRADVELKVRSLVNGLGGGVGIQLGDLGADLHLAGLDLDSCIGEDGMLALWAQAIIDGLPTYAEISPSGRGLKMFFYVITEGIRPFLDFIGADPEQWATRRAVPGFDARDHGAAVEIYFSHRYFAVTENRWLASPDALATLDHDALERLARHIPPPRSQTKSGSTGGDNSRSARALAKGCEFCRQQPDCTFEDMAAALRTDLETAAWCREKGDAVGERELHRIWEKAQGAKHAYNPEITRLAALPLLEYEHERETAARNLRSGLSAR